jgi:hypothetical protein
VRGLLYIGVLDLGFIAFFETEKLVDSHTLWTHLAWA